MILRSERIPKSQLTGSNLDSPGLVRLRLSLPVDSFTNKIDISRRLQKRDMHDSKFGARYDGGVNEASPPPPWLVKDLRCISVGCAGIIQLRDVIETGKERFCFMKQRLVR